MGPPEGSDILKARSSGLLLHPTSLPGPHGIGDLGPGADAFVDFLEKSGSRFWQILPLGPAGFGGSPYQSTSAFAGNPLLISLERIRDEGMLSQEEITECSLPEGVRVDLNHAEETKGKLLNLVYDRFEDAQFVFIDDDFTKFKDENSWWLQDFALYSALKEENGGLPWFQWPQDLIARDQEAIKFASERLHGRIDFFRFLQFLFFRQWFDLKTKMKKRGMMILGDIPIFPAHDSADVWANAPIFKLDQNRLPTVVAGVPPDYFSPEGQLWGNPVYRWDVLAENDFSWWIDRFRHMLNLVDVVRVDHFRGFIAAWEVPAAEKTAINGEWVEGPGGKLFDQLRTELGTLPIVAEDLGILTPDVGELRKKLKFPGMKILQFAFDSDALNPYLPHNYDRDFIVYTGTHDNDTTIGWYASIDDHVRNRVKEYVGISTPDIPWDLIRLAYASTADIAIIPMQDILGLGNDARMNFPGESQGNWMWRFPAGWITDQQSDRLRHLATVYGRLPNALGEG